MSASVASVSPRFSVRGVQLSRAALAAIAALMITFSPDHSAAVGLAVFSGFGIATGLVLAIAAWLTYPAGRRWGAVLLAAAAIVAGMIAGVPALRSTVMFFAVVISWALVSGLIELLWGLRDRRRGPRAEARDAMTLGVIGLLLGIALLFVRADYALDYAIEDGGRTMEFTLTGITIAVGVYGAYAAIVAVYLAIAAFSPRPAVVAPASVTDSVSGTDSVAEERV